MKFLFDLGGVFFDWNPKYFYKKIISNKKDLNFFLTKVCNDEWNIKQDAGRSIKNAETELILRFPDYENLIKMYYINHRSMIKKTFHQSIEILKYLKSKNHNCYVLSNWSAETFKGMTEDYDFLNSFDGLLISGEEGLIKPNPNIYKLAIERFDLMVSNCVFIDDKFENVNTAKKLGFKIIHLVDPSTIKKDIEFFLK